MKYYVLVIEAIVVLLEVVSTAIFVTEDLTGSIIYLLILAAGLTLTGVYVVLRRRMPAVLRVLLHQTLLYCLIFRCAEILYYFVSSSYTMITVIFMNQGTYDVQEKSSGYFVMFLIFLILVTYYIGLTVYFVKNSKKEKNDWFVWALLPQVGLALAQYIMPASSLIAHIRAEQQLIVTSPIWVVWIYIIEAIALVVIGTKALIQKKKSDSGVRGSAKQSGNDNKGQKVPKYRQKKEHNN